jgi:hypothetical protein
MAGGDTVSVKSSGFTGTTGVSFGTVAAPTLAVASDTQLFVTNPLLPPTSARNLRGGCGRTDH